MKRTSDTGKKWKDEMVQRWERVVILYHRARNRPSVKCCIQLGIALLKIIVPILLKKMFKYFLNE